MDEARKGVADDAAQVKDLGREVTALLRDVHEAESQIVRSLR